MADNHEEKNTRSSKLVRVGGRGDMDRLYDSYGNELPPEPEKLPEREPEPKNAGQDVRKSQHPRRQHAEEVQLSLRREQFAAAEEDEGNSGEGKTARKVRRNVDPKVQQDQLRSYQLRQEHKKIRKKRTLFAVLRAGIFILCIGILALIVLLSGKMHNRINTQYIRVGSIDNAATGTLSFLRNEIPIETQRSGAFVAYVNEGDRVSNGALIGYVIQSEYESQLKQLRAVEAKLTAAQQAQSYLSGAKPAELLVIEDAINKAMSELSAMAMSGNLTDYARQAEELKLLYKEKNDILMNAETTDSYLNSLQQERNNLLRQIESSMYAVNAPESGIVSFCTDGQEQAASNVCSMLSVRVSQTDFTTLTSCTVTETVLNEFALPSGVLSDMAGASVSRGDVIARITPDVSYYVTMAVDSAEGLRITPGRTAQVRTSSGNMAFEANVCGAFYTGERAVIVLSCDSALMMTISERTVSGEIVFSHTEGLKVPLRALTEWDDAGVTARITVVRSGYVEYVYVNVLATDNDYAIINSKSSLDDGGGISVRASDEYVIEYEKVREGQAL